MLTDRAIKALKPELKPYKRADEKGLYLIVRPNGARWWRFKYVIDGREKSLSMGTYPDTSLALARAKRDEARADLSAGVDPGEKRKVEKARRADTFKAVANQWLDTLNVRSATREQLRQRLKLHVFPHIGRYPVRSVTPTHVLTILQRIEGKGASETAHRVRSLCDRVFRYAVVIGRADRNPAGDLRGALAPVRGQGFAAITEPRRIGELLRAIDGYQGQPAVMAALKLAPLVFVRPGELRAAEWTEFDLKRAEWRIPAARMKMGREHIVPLAPQALTVLEELWPITGESRLVFPSLRSAERPISDNTLNAALRRLGFGKDEMTAHGFRTMASTRLNEMGFAPDVIELQLAHADSNKVRAAYNRSEKIAERRRMMKAWASYLDGLKADRSAKVRAIRE